MEFFLYAVVFYSVVMATYSHCQQKGFSGAYHTLCKKVNRPIWPYGDFKFGQLAGNMNLGLSPSGQLNYSWLMAVIPEISKNGVLSLYPKPSQQSLASGGPENPTGFSFQIPDLSEKVKHRF